MLYKKYKITKTNKHIFKKWFWLGVFSQGYVSRAESYGFTFPGFEITAAQASAAIVIMIGAKDEVR